MTTEQLQNEIILSMSPSLDDIQLQKLQTVLADKLKDVLIECTSLITYEDINNHYLEMFIACKRVEGVAKTSLKQYYYALQRFMDTGIDLARATTNHVRAYLAKLATNGCSNSTVNTIRAYLSSFYKWMYDEGYMKKNIVETIGKVKQEKREKPVLNSIDIENIKNVCADDREMALITLLESTGMRCAEITNLKVSDIDWVNKKILIHGKGSKDRWGYMTPKCQISLEHFLNNRGYDAEYVFGYTKGNHRQINTNSIERTVKTICERAGLDVHVHMFRHYFCTELCRKGMPIQEVQILMGHVSIETTAKVYNHISIDEVSNSFKKYCA